MARAARLLLDQGGDLGAVVALAARALHLYAAAAPSAAGHEPGTLEETERRLRDDPTLGPILTDALTLCRALEEETETLVPAEAALADQRQRCAALLERVAELHRRIEAATKVPWRSRSWRDAARTLLGEARRHAPKWIAATIIITAALWFLSLWFDPPERYERRRGPPPAPAVAASQAPTSEDPPLSDAVQNDPHRCLTGSYFANQDRTTPVFVRRDCRLRFDWGDQGPGAPLTADAFSVRWEGMLWVPESAEYEFILGSDDGSRLFIDGALVVDNWLDQAFQTVTAKVNLERDRSYALRIDYYQNAGLAQVALTWKSATLPEQALSGQYVSRPRPPAGNPDAVVP